MADDKLPKCGCGTAPVQEWGQSYRLDSRVVCPACGTATRWFSSDDAGARTAWTRALSSPGLEALRDAVQFVIDWISGLSPSRGTPLEDRMSAKKTLQAALGQTAGAREDVTEAQLEAAVTAASEHIAPCGHNELGDVFDAVIVAFRSIGLRVGYAAQREPGGRR